MKWYFIQKKAAITDCIITHYGKRNNTPWVSSAISPKK